MTVLLDTNVLIDAAVVSRSYHGTAVRLIAAAERDTIDGLVAPTSIATYWYVAHEREDTDPRPLLRPSGRRRDAIRSHGTLTPTKSASESWDR